MLQVGLVSLLPWNFNSFLLVTVAPKTGFLGFLKWSSSFLQDVLLFISQGIMILHSFTHLLVPCLYSMVIVFIHYPSDVSSKDEEGLHLVQKFNVHLYLLQQYIYFYIFTQFILIVQMQVHLHFLLPLPNKSLWKSLQTAHTIIILFVYSDEHFQLFVRLKYLKAISHFADFLVDMIQIFLVCGR